MAILSSDKKSVTVQKGDTLSQIALDYSSYSGGKTYQQLASLNDIPNPDLIYVDQVIKLTGTSTSSSSTNKNTVTITAFGLQSNSDNTLFATWSWSKSYTDKYQISWEYDTGDQIWFVGSSSAISVDSIDAAASRQSTYSIPSNATRVRFRVKPVAKTNSSGYYRWTGNWTSYQYYNVSDNPPSKPGTPSVEIEQYKLTAKLENLDVNATHIEFQIVKDDTSVFKTGTAKIVTNSASYSCNVTAGSEYKVRCRAKKDEQYSAWSDYSSNIKTAPAAPASITSCKATTETSVKLEWAKSTTAETYEIQYTTEKRYFDTSDEPTSKTGIENTQYEITGLTSGDEYFFRVRAVNEKGESGWTDIKSAIVGKAPAAPTTWSSTTTAVVGESVTLYWVHNSEDGSSQTYGDLELYVGGELVPTEVIKNSEDEDEKDKTSSLVLTTDKAEAAELEAAGRNVILIATNDGTSILWRVRTAGITNNFGDWSIQREITIYAPPTLEFRVTDADSNVLDTITEFPFYVYGLAGPNTQVPIGYHLTITSNDIYETVDAIGNSKTVNAGDEVYSKYFDISDSLLVEMSAGNIDLENNASYTATCKVTMDSGLTAEGSQNFTVSWTDAEYTPNAEISVDTETYVAHIYPYCEHEELVFYKAESSNGIYTLTSTVVEIEEGTAVMNGDDFVYATSGDQVFSGTTTGGDLVYYCTVIESTMVDGVTLSVYRKEFDGSFTELATGLKNLSNTHITDPHPALDYARYRIVAVTDATGAVSFCDIPGFPVGGKSIIIQWDEAWSDFAVTADDEFEQPVWSGSMLKLPYNVDVSDNHKPDVSSVNYIGRAHPVTYYGTQVGHTATWNAEIDATDKETLYGLRRLANWLGDVYVREPSGSGYWANVTVSYSQKHCDLTIPVTFDVTRVEGGV